ncbi:hypothetical protein BC834DRAFT_829875 [Gloeopeniophorella convolvens]|nr:hypothetical protein BC834DRAFT_829875 [Gloeopeniophorella convolvens]
MSQSLRAVQRFRVRELFPRARPADALGPRSTVPNPFVPHKNPNTGRWAPPKYSLRRQADLIKAARASGTLHLLPPGPKLGAAQLAVAVAAAPKPTEHSPVEVSGGLALHAAPAPEAQSGVWAGPVEWEGAVRARAIAGADTGNRLYAGKKRMFKGHKWERVRERRTARTKMLVRDMDKRVERFKAVRAPAAPWCAPFPR